MSFAAGSPTSGQLEIGIALVLQDRFSNQAREASSVIRGLHNDAKNAIAANMQAVQGIATRGLAVAALGAKVMSDSIKYGAEYQDTLITIRSILGATTEDIDSLNTVAKDIGLKTMFNAQEVASGMKYLAMAGATAQEIKDMIEGASYVAGATGMDIGGKGGAADMITNVIRAFGLSAKSAVDVGDMLAKGTLSANMSMTDLAESIRYAAADMVNLKVQLPQVIAMIGTLGDSGIQASLAGTALSNMARYTMKSLTQPSYKGGKALAMLGLSKEDFVDAKGDLIDFSAILTKIHQATVGKDMLSLERAGVFLDIFGVRGNRAAVAMLNNMEKYKSLLQTITHESKGFARGVMEERMAGLKGTLDRMQEAWANLKIGFSEALAPVIIPLMESVTWIVNGIRSLFESKAGPFLASLTAFLTIGIGIASVVALIRSRLVILRNDSQVSARNMFSILLGGWNSAKLAATQYMQIEGAIIAQRKAGIGGSIAGSLMMGGMPLGGVVGGKTSTGKMVFRDTKTGRFVSASTASQAARGASASTITKGLMGAGGAAVAGTVIKNGLLKTIAGGLGRVVGIFGGPWGLAITAGMFLIPKLISAISGNKDSQDQNTSAVNFLTENMKAERDSRTPEELRNLQILEELRALSNSLFYWASEGKNKPVANIQIFQDGKKTFEELLANRDQQIRTDTNTK